MGHHRDVHRRRSAPGWAARYVLIPGLIFAPLPLPASNGTDPEPLPPGTWGGRGAELQVAPDSAKLEFNCAFARIDAPVVIQPSGAFAVAGLYFSEPGGPGRIGDPEPAGAAATFYGVRENSEIRLRVELVDVGRTLGPFVLHRSQIADLEKCL